MVTTSPAHVLTKNFLGITRAYADAVLFPAQRKVAQMHQPHSVQLSFAGKRVKFLLYTPLLVERMLPAFAHLSHVQGEPDLTIHIWDTQSTGVGLREPYRKREYMSELAVGTKAAVEEGFYGVYFSGEESIQVYDEAGKSAYFWTHDANEIPGWVIGAPLRAILHWYLASVGVQLVHGAVVGLRDEAVLLTAKSGSGKSTTALACVLDSMTYLGDDYVAVKQDGKDLMAYAIYNSAKCTPNTLDALPQFRPHAREVPSQDERKSVIYINDAFPGQMRESARVRAILVPSLVGERPTGLDKVSKLKTLLAMAPTTLFQLPYTSVEVLGRLRKIVEETPSYALLLGDNIPETSKVIRQIFEDYSL